MKLVPPGNRVLDATIKFYAVALTLLFLYAFLIRYIVLESMWFCVGAVLVWRVLRLKKWAIGAACLVQLVCLMYSLMHVFAGNWNQYYGGGANAFSWNLSAFTMFSLLIVGAWQSRKLLKNEV